jgi:hypothetical protein
MQNSLGSKYEEEFRGYLLGQSPFSPRALDDLGLRRE